MASRSACSLSNCTSISSGNDKPLSNGSAVIDGVGIQFDVAAHHSSVVKTLVITRLHEPFRQCAMIAQFRELSQQINTNRLEDVARVLMHAELYWNRVDEVLVFVDEPFPSILVAFQTACDQGFVRRILRCVSALVWRLCRSSRSRALRIWRPNIQFIRVPKS